MAAPVRALCIALLLSAPAWAAEKPARPQLDVVFVLDTTRSMTGLIEGAKQKIWSIASRMASGKPTPRIRVGLVAYRDRGDAYITKRFDLTEDLDTVYKNLRGLEAGGGGDGPEHVGRGLGEAVKLMSWDEGPRTAKLVFLVGDAPAHDDYADGWVLNAMASLATERGIVVNTIRCGDDAATEAQFREVARLGGGTFLSIGQEGGMAAVATPFDAELSKLNGELAKRAVYAGSERARALGEASRRELSALAGSVAADRLAWRAKSGHEADAPADVTAFGGVDLVAHPEALAGIRDEELPEVLKKLAPHARRPYLDQLHAEREGLEERAAKTAKARDGWLAAHAPKSDFDDAVMGNVAAQAAKVGVRY